MIKNSVLLPCSVHGAHSPSRPTNVHTIRLGDIDVVAAMGDSYTAGLGVFATNSLTFFSENRGVTALIGKNTSVRKLNGGNIFGEMWNE